MQEKNYGKILTVESFDLDDAQKLIKENPPEILITQCKVSADTKEFLSKNQVTLYDNVTPEKVNFIRRLICSSAE